MFSSLLNVVKNVATIALTPVAVVTHAAEALTDAVVEVTQDVVKDAKETFR